MDGTREKSWTPFFRQCFVVTGASINMSQMGLMLGFTPVLITQLLDNGSYNDVPWIWYSWLAALPVITHIAGNLIVPILMGKLGRRMTNLISIVLILSGWVCISAAQNIIWLFIARFLQGLSTGMSSCLTPVLIGEYASPKIRGAFLVFISLLMTTASLTVQTLGSYFSWKIVTLSMTILALVDLLIVVLSPESPSWLADKGKTEECKKVFRWLRGSNETEELNSLIQSSIQTHKAEANSSPSLIVRCVSEIKEKEFYKPLIVMIHLYIMLQWGGVNIVFFSINHFVAIIIGYDKNVRSIILSLGVQRIVSSVLAILVVRVIKRRTMLFTACGMNAFVLVLVAVYIFAKENYNLPFNHYIIGVLLVHALIMTMTIGSLPLPFTIAGEIFALKYKSLSSGFTYLFYSVNMFFPTVSLDFLLHYMGLHGLFCLYACVMTYCLIVVWYLLPETKDKTLQDIEDTFKGKYENDDQKPVAQSKNLSNLE